MTDLALPRYTTAFLDKDGKVATVWYRLLSDLVASIGSAEGVDLEPITAVLSEAVVQIAALNTQPQDGRREIDGLRQALDDIQQRVQSLSQSQPDEAAIRSLRAKVQELEDYIHTQPGPIAQPVTAAAPSYAAFMAYKNAAQAIPAATFTTVLFQVEVFDELGNYDPTTSTFTAPTTGLYVFNMGLYGTQGTATARIAAIYINGVEFLRVAQTAAEPGAAVIIGSTSGPIRLTAGDQVTARYFSGIADTLVANSNITIFGGFQIK